MIVLIVIYILLITMIAFFAVYRSFLTISALNKAANNTERPLVSTIQLPCITIQLPVFNEPYVINSLIDAVCQLDYPADKLQIQILDDSDDETSTVIAERIAYWRAHSINVEHIQRQDRKEYKPGALAEGLKTATGEYIAIFDADFVPEPGWLRQALAGFYTTGGEQTGLVQTNWSHINANDSALTQAQNQNMEDIAIQQTLRAKSGLFIVFNGTAGLWKKTCIEDSGGWSGQTLAEDADLAYRAQLAGWKLVYDERRQCQAELPGRMLDYKLQQARWTRGTMQLARLLIPALIKAKGKLQQRLDAIVYLASPLINLLLVALLLCRCVLVFHPGIILTILDLITLSACLGIILPVIHSWLRQATPMPLNLLLLAGMAFHNTIYLLQGLFGPAHSEFKRTPKQGESKNEGEIARHARVDKSLLMLVTEVLFLFLLLAETVLLIACQQYLMLPLLLVYLLGSSWVSGQTTREYFLEYFNCRKSA